MLYISVRVESEHSQHHRLLSLPPCSQHVKSDTRQQHGSTKDVTDQALQSKGSNIHVPIDIKRFL